MPIPPGTKFHGVAPDVETENKGSAVRNLDRDAYTIEEFGGGGTFEYKANTPASVTMTFNSVPAVGSTVTINGVVIEFTTNNPPNPTSGNKCRLSGNTSGTAANFNRFVNNDSTAAFYFITDPLPCLSIKVPDDSSSLKLIANKTGTEGNTIDCTSQTPAVTFSSDTFQGGDDETSDVLDNSGNVYIKAVACEKFSHGLPVYLVGIDPETALPLATTKATYLNSTKRASRPGSNVVIGLAVDFTANGSFNTISNGDTFDICISGVLKDVFMMRDPVTNLYPEYGDSLSVTASLNTLQRDNGNGNSLAIMLALDDSNRGVVFVNGGISNSSLRRTADGVSPLSTTRTPAIPLTSSSSIDGGSLVVLDPGAIDEKTAFCRCRHYTSSDSASDIFGIAAFSTFGSRVEDGTSVCTGGTVGGIYVYDASGALVSTLTTASVGLVVYAGDGTINPSHVLTTDPTSGVAVGRLQNLTIWGSNATDKWDILFEPYRLSSGGGGGGSTTGEDLSLNVRSSPYSSTGDHEGTVLSLGTLGLTAGTVYMWDGTEWSNANAGAVGTADGLMGVSTATAVAPDVLVSGIIQMSVTATVGDPLYLDNSNGLLTATAPTGSQEIVRVMGYKLDTNRVYFNPSSDFFEIA